MDPLLNVDHARSKIHYFLRPGLHWGDQMESRDTRLLRERDDREVSCSTACVGNHLRVSMALDNNDTSLQH